MFLSTRMAVFAPSPLEVAKHSRHLLRNTHTSPVSRIQTSSRHGYATGRKQAGESGNTGEQQPAPSGQPKRADPKSPEYKAYQRTWTTVMIGTPIILVCSYELWQRLVEGKQPLSLEPKDTTALTHLTPHAGKPSAAS